MERTALILTATPARVRPHRMRTGPRAAQPGDPTLGREVVGAGAAAVAMVLLGSSVAAASALLAYPIASGHASFNAFLIAAVREADAATVGVIVGCVPVVLALAGPMLERRQLSARVV